MVIQGLLRIPLCPILYTSDIQCKTFHVVQRKTIIVNVQSIVCERVYHGFPILQIVFAKIIRLLGRTSLEQHLPTTSVISE